MYQRRALRSRHLCGCALAGCADAAQPPLLLGILTLVAMNASFVPLLGDTSSARTLKVAGVRIRFLVSSEENGGQWALLEYTAPPGFSGPQPHLHRRTTEFFYVLEGQLTVRLGAPESLLAPGGFVLVPPGAAHSFSNPNAEPIRFLIQMSPGGAEGYFAALSELIQNAPS